MRGSASSSQVFFRGILSSAMAASSEGSRNWEIDELSNMIGIPSKIGNTVSQSLQRIKPVLIFFDPNFSIDRNIKFKELHSAHFKKFKRSVHLSFPIENLAYETLPVTEIKSEFRCSIKDCATEAVIALLGMSSKRH